MPPFVMVKVPPVSSSNFSVPLRARLPPGGSRRACCPPVPGTARSSGAGIRQRACGARGPGSTRTRSACPLPRVPATPTGTPPGAPRPAGRPPPPPHPPLLTRTRRPGQAVAVVACPAMRTTAPGQRHHRALVHLRDDPPDRCEVVEGSGEIAGRRTGRREIPQGRDREHLVRNEDLSSRPLAGEPLDRLQADFQRLLRHFCGPRVLSRGHQPGGL